jgi:hypothetical protein
LYLTVGGPHCQAIYVKKPAHQYKERETSTGKRLTSKHQKKHKPGAALVYKALLGHMHANGEPHISRLSAQSFMPIIKNSTCGWNWDTRQSKLFSKSRVVLPQMGVLRITSWLRFIS